MDLKNIRVVLQIETSLREIFSKKVLTTPRDVPRYTSNQFPPIDTVFAQSSPLPSPTRYRTSAHPLEIPSAGPNRPFEKTIKSIQPLEKSSSNPRHPYSSLFPRGWMQLKGGGMEGGRSISTVQIRSSRYRLGSTPARG